MHDVDFIAYFMQEQIILISTLKYT